MYCCTEILGCIFPSADIKIAVFLESQFDAALMLNCLQQLFASGTHVGHSCPFSHGVQSFEGPILITDVEKSFGLVKIQFGHAKVYPITRTEVP